MPQPASPSSIGRRRFLTSLAALAGGGFATLVGVAPPAGAADTVTLWRLNASWGYPVGPNGKTRCTCRACHLHAANKIFRTSDAAVAARIHPCCLCQPESFVVPAGCVTALFASSGGDATDRRYEGVAAALSGCFATSPPPTAVHLAHRHRFRSARRRPRPRNVHRFPGQHLAPSSGSTGRPPRRDPHRRPAGHIAER